MSVLNTFQYKHCLCILTLPKFNTLLTEQIFTIYRPEKSEMVETIQTELSKKSIRDSEMNSP